MSTDLLHKAAAYDSIRRTGLLQRSTAHDPPSYTSAVIQPRQQQKSSASRQAQLAAIGTAAAVAGK